MKKVLFILFICLGVNLNISAQKQYNKGYVVLLQGDTLWGKVKDRKIRMVNSKLYKNIKFKSSGLFHHSYKPADIIGYGYNENHFRSMPLTQENKMFFKTISYAYGDPVFLRVRIDDYLTLFEYEYIEEGRITSYYLLKRQDEIRYTGIPLFGFKKKMVDFFSDHDEIVKKIISKEYRYKDIYEIVLEYNRSFDFQ